MANWSDPRPSARFAPQSQIASAARDEGLRSYMLSVYNYMASAVFLTGIIAVLVANTSLMSLFAQEVLTRQGPALVPTALGWIAVLLPLAFGLPLSFSRGGFKLSTLQFLFWGYAVSVGVSFFTLFIVYTDTSIAQAFFAAAAGFAGLSLYGYTTKRNLQPLGAFLVIGVVGLLVALLINVFLQSGTLNLIISVAGVGIFAVLTAFRTQEIKLVYDEVAGTEMQDKVAVLGAFQLYVTFINMFLFLLRLIGSSRN